MSTALQMVRSLFELERWRPPALRFPAAQEQRYVAAGRADRLTHIVRSGWVALICYNVFGVSDRVMVSDVYEQALMVRLLWFTPTGLAILLLCSLFRDWVLKAPNWLTEGLVVLSGVLAAVSVMYIVHLSHSDVALLYRSGLVPILVYGNLVQRYRFRWAAGFTAAVMLVYCVGYVSSLGRPSPYTNFETLQFMFVLGIGLYTLVVNYRIELEDRRRFDRAERASNARTRLEATQRELDDLSRRDALTGVPNRRHLDEYLLKQWQDPRHQGQPLSLLLIDVDHFKAFNDRYGHPAGDQCLQHVAMALSKALGPVRGVLARWGGEEFVAVLPNTGAAVALQVAEGLRGAVEGLHLRHDAAPLRLVSISVGVAAWPVDADLNTLERLVAMADGALYQAKAAGRNRCHGAPAYDAAG